MKKCLLALALFVPLLCCSQKMQRNYGAVDSSQHLIAFAQLHGEYDHIIAYTTEGFWESDLIHYTLIGEKQGAYFKGIMICKRKGDKSWPTPTLKMKPTNAKIAEAIFKRLDEAGLWKLDADSLNNLMIRSENGKLYGTTLHDATNFRFELIEGEKFTAVESYAPDWFFKEMPGYLQLRRFIKIRDEFIKTYKAL